MFHPEAVQGFTAVGEVTQETWGAAGGEARGGGCAHLSRSVGNGRGCIRSH